MTLPFERDQRRVQKMTIEFVEPACDVWKEHNNIRPSEQRTHVRTVQVSVWTGRACDSADRPMKLEGVYQVEQPAGRPLKRCAEIVMMSVAALFEEQEDLEADTFTDMLNYRRKGLPLTELILADLDAHEDYVDAILEDATNRRNAKKKVEIDS